MKENAPHLFWPQNIGPFEAELRDLLTKLQNTENSEISHKLIENHLGNLPKYPGAELLYLRYRAYLLVLLDLLRQGATLECRQGRLYLWPPDWTKQVKGNEAIRAQKDAIRKSLQWERLAQLGKSSVQEFVKYMERERPFRGQIVSIRSLIADGEQLANVLQAVIDLENGNVRLQAICSAIQPYLQLATEDSRCEYTNLRLLDIWRYFRHTWSIPYNSTPGRNMFYLIRDANQPFHPIIGIAGLGNSMMQLTARDDAIGWTTQALQNRIESPHLTDQEAQIIVDMLHTTLKEGVDGIAKDDLASEEEVQKPNDTLIRRLQEIIEESRAERTSLLRKRQTPPSSPNGAANQILLLPDNEELPFSVYGELTEQAQEVLFRAKRASILRDLLLAKQTLHRTPYPIASKEGLRAFWKTHEGKQTIKTLVRENKKRKVGINIMDIIVCGAVPPYNFILGGKLVAMLLTSPQIVHDYEQKYKNYISNIASKMKGEDVYREAHLVFLGTTSLYASGSSQYNRIKIPLPKSEEDKIEYIKYGLTKGYGSVHFSEETIKHLDKLQEYAKEARLINNRFGEGINPKFRRVSAGLSNIGLTASDKFLRHRSQRIVYGVPLGKKTYSFLRGETDSPEYFFDSSSKEKIKSATEYIIQFWAQRWLLSRVQKSGILRKMASFSVDEVLISSELQASKQAQQPKQLIMDLQVNYDKRSD
jgi:hypothetical protein